MINIFKFIATSRDADKEINSIQDLEELKDRARIAFQAFAVTPGGEAFLKYMYVMYCDRSCIDEKPEVTYGNVMLKELVENLIKYSSTEKGDI